MSAEEAAAFARALRTGQRAPEIGLRDLNGNNITIASLRGNVVLVDFNMNGHNGAWLLERVREKYPKCERMLLSGSSQFDLSNFITPGLVDRVMAVARGEAVGTEIVGGARVRRSGGRLHLDRRGDLPSG